MRERESNLEHKREVKRSEMETKDTEENEHTAQKEGDSEAATGNKRKK